jgi:hypothetical protein
MRPFTDSLISDQTRPAAYERDRPMAVPLQMHEPHDRHETPDVETRRARIEAAVTRHDTGA